MTSLTYDSLEPCFDGLGVVKANVEQIDGELSAALAARDPVKAAIAADRAEAAINRLISNAQKLRAGIREAVRLEDAA